MSKEITRAVEVGGVELSVTFDYTKSTKGKLDGPWEYCYPAEPAEIDIIGIVLAGNDITDMLNNAAVDAILENLLDLMVEEGRDYG